MDLRQTLPVHPPPDRQSQPGGEPGTLQVCGLVARPPVLLATALGALQRQRFADRFVCEEGWAVEHLVWEGIPLRSVVALCAPLPTARYVRICAGEFWYVLPIGELDGALLCDQLNDAPLAREHGAPWRLVVAGGACFTSVKWVDRLEFVAESGTASAEHIARGRLASQASTI